MAVEGAGEVAVKVLLGHQVGAPGRDAAGAVVDGADAPAAARVGGGLQAIVPGGRAGQFHVSAAGGDAAVVLAVAHHGPAAVLAPHLDDAAAVRRHLDPDACPGRENGRDTCRASVCQYG